MKVFDSCISSGAVLRPRRCAVFLFAALAAMLLSVSPLRAQLSSNPSAVSLQAVLTTSLTLSASPGLVTFNLVPGGQANASGPINLTTSWVLRPNVGDVTMYAFFTSPAAALTDGAGNNIPSANVLGSPDGSAFVPFTGTSPFAVGSSLVIFTERILGNNRSKTRNDTLDLRIDTSGLALPAGTYTGVLRIQAQAL